MDKDGETPLFKASQRGDVEMCQLLVRTIILMLLFIIKRYSYSASTYIYICTTFSDCIRERPCVFILVRNNLKHHFSKTRVTSILTSLGHFGRPSSAHSAVVKHSTSCSILILKCRNDPLLYHNHLLYLACLFVCLCKLYWVSWKQAPIMVCNLPFYVCIYIYIYIYIYVMYNCLSHRGLCRLCNGFLCPSKAGLTLPNAINNMADTR